LGAQNCVLILNGMLPDNIHIVTLETSQKGIGISA